jgi:LAO/AO transport system kinase
MKAGILQLANIYIINKCDLADPLRMMQELSENTVPVGENTWRPPVLKSSASKCEGIKEIIDSILLHQEYENKNKLGKEIRIKRLKKEILQNALMLAEFKFKNEIEKIDAQEIKMLSNGTTTAMFLAQKIFDKNIIFESGKNENQ